MKLIINQVQITKSAQHHRVAVSSLHAMQLKACGSRLTCKVANKYLDLGEHLV